MAYFYFEVSIFFWKNLKYCFKGLKTKSLTLGRELGRVSHWKEGSFITWLFPQKKHTFHFLFLLRNS